MCVLITCSLVINDFSFHYQQSRTYVPTPLEPVEITKSMDAAAQDSLYRNPEEPSTVLTLECNNLKSDSSTLVHENSVKMESLVTNNGQSMSRVSTADVNTSVTSATANVTQTSATSGSWTPLTPPQSTLQ